MSLLRNWTKLKSIRKLVPENFPKRFQSTCVDKKKKEKEDPRRQKFKALQAKMQQDVHAPVYLIMGSKDKLLFNIALGLVGITTLMSFSVIFKLATRTGA